jgi:hypothetical protein
MSVILLSWLDDGIVLNIGTESQPKYRRLMRLQEKRKAKAKQESKQATPAEQQVVVAEGTGATNGNGE